MHGKWMWQARVSYRGRRASRLCETQEEAKRVTAGIRRQLMTEATEAAQIRLRCLSPDQLARALSFLPPPFRQIARLAALTGCALSKVAQAVWTSRRLGGPRTCA